MEIRVDIRFQQFDLRPDSECKIFQYQQQESNNMSINIQTLVPSSFLSPSLMTFSYLFSLLQTPQELVPPHSITCALGVSANYSSYWWTSEKVSKV